MVGPGRLRAATPLALRARIAALRGSSALRAAVEHLFIGSGVRRLLRQTIKNPPDGGFLYGGPGKIIRGYAAHPSGPRRCAPRFVRAARGRRTLVYWVGSSKALATDHKKTRRVAGFCMVGPGRLRAATPLALRARVAALRGSSALRAAVEHLFIGSGVRRLLRQTIKKPAGWRVFVWWAREDSNSRPCGS